MLVGERMTRPVITIHPELPVADALNLMKIEHVRRFPVVDGRGKLVGIVAQQDLMNASASNISTLSVWELGYLLSRITIERVMTRDVIVVYEDTAIEEAARILVNHKIGGLPVMRGDELVGIITETDLFKIFLELLGARYEGVRVSLLVKDEPGLLYSLAGAIRELGANIISIGSYMGDSTGTTGLVIKIEGASVDAVRQAVTPFAIRVKDIRLTKAG